MPLVPSNPSLHVSWFASAALSHVLKSELRSPVLLCLPFGFWVAEMDQLSSSEEKSSRSRQSATALESRKSPKTVPNWDTMPETCLSTPTVDLRELRNWDVGTVRHSLCRRSEGAEPGELSARQQRKARKMTAAEASLGGEGAMDVRTMKARGKG